MTMTYSFKSPNHTQTPNDLFDTLLAVKDFKDSELRVTLTVIRHTFGYHRKKFRMSLRKLARLSGLSASGAYEGALSAEKRGTMKRAQDGGITIWNLCVDDGVSPDDTSVSPSDTGVSPDDTPSIKETDKERGNTTHKPPRAKTPQQEMIDMLCSVMGLEVNLNAARVARFASELVKMTITPAQIESVYGAKDTAWWYQQDWRGKRGQKPTETAIRETLAQAAASGSSPAVKVIRPPQPKVIRMPQ